MKKLLSTALLFCLLAPAFGQARLFVKTNSDTVIVPGSVETVDGTNSYSLWIYLSATPGAVSTYDLYSDTQGTGQIGFRILYLNDVDTVLKFRCNTEVAFGTDIIRDFAYTLTAAQWYHVGVTVDASLGSGNNDVKLYVNGSAVTETAHSGGNWATNVTYYGLGGIGCLRWGPPNISFTDGRIARIGRYKTVLNAAQIGALARGARLDRITPHTDNICAYDIDGLGSTEVDRSNNRLNSTSISGTSRANGPPTVPRP